MSASLFQRIKTAARVFRRSGNVRNRYEGAYTRRSQSTLTTAAQSPRFDITKEVRLELLKKARTMEQNEAIVQRMADLWEQYTVGTGLQIFPASSDDGFNAECLRAWEEWKPYCDLTSRNHFDALQSVIARACFIDGESFVALTRGDTGRPRIQIVESHRCYSPGDRNADEGKSIIDGVSIDANGRPIAYNFSKEGQFSWLTSAAFLDPVPSEFCVHIFEPIRASQYRGLTMLYAVLNDLHDLSDLQLLEMKAAKEAARTSRIIKTPAGEVSDEDLMRGEVSVGDDSTTVSRWYKEAFGGEVEVLKPGHDMEVFSSNRPTVTTTDYWKYLTSKVCAGTGIPYVLVFPESMQGTVYRGALDMATAFFRSRSMFFGSAFQRIWEYVIQSEIKGKYPDDWKKTNIRPPRAVNVDVGRNSTAMIAELRVSARTLEDVHAECGDNWQQKMEQRAKEIAFANDLGVKYKLKPEEITQLTGTEAKVQQQQQPNAAAAKEEGQDNE